MSLFLKLLVFPLVLTNFQRLIAEGGYIKWEVMDVPLVFGDNVTIRCTYHNRLSCTDHVFWTWTTGKENELIMNNGTLSEKYKNGKKFSERRSPCTQHSILVISNFSEIDYKKKYKCGIVKINSPENSFVQYPKEEITFENISYEYAPTQKMVSAVLNSKDQQVFFSLKIDKIYPVPECQATFADTDVTNVLKVQKKKTGLFYKVVFTYTTSGMSMTSFGDLCIKCNGKSRQWKSVDPFCKKKSDLTTESNLFVSTVEDLTTERNFVDISPLKGLYLAAIIFVGVFYTLYPVSVMVVMIRLYYASKDQFDKIKQILSGIENISYVCIGSHLMFGVLSIGGLDLQVRPELPIQVEYGLNVFSIIVMLCPCICCIPISSVELFAERKLPKKTWCSKFGTVLWQIFYFSCIMLSTYLVYGKTKLTSTMVLNRTYSNVFFFWMPILEQLLLIYFLFSKHMCFRLHISRQIKILICFLWNHTHGLDYQIFCMASIEKLHKTRDRRLHRETERSDSVNTASNSQNNEEMRELVILEDPNRQSDEEMNIDV